MAAKSPFAADRARFLDVADSYAARARALEPDPGVAEDGTDESAAWTESAAQRT